MGISTHVSLAGVERSPEGSAGTRALIEWAAQSGLRGVRLDATKPDVRPRALDRSARRDLAASIRRSGLAFGGVDLLIPAEHFTDPVHAQRAADATARACELAADLAGLTGDADARTVAVVLPAEAPDRMVADLNDAAADVGVTLADCAHPARDDASRAHVLAGIDPPSVIVGGESPAKLAARLGAQLAHARLADVSGIGRCAVGSAGGKLDVTAYAAALAVAGVHAVTIDLRGLRDVDAGLHAAQEAWAQALTLPGM
ncbi:MAG: hypothetical protein RIB60_05165 [Phycisphaerales bacterium]